MTGLAVKLARARRQMLAGRDAELAILLAALSAGSRTRLVHVAGPGGIGKTTLLSAVATQAPVPVAWVDGDGVADLAAAVANELAGLRRDAGGVRLLIVDRVDGTSEAFATLFTVLLGDDGEGLRIVTAGRAPMPMVLRADPGVAALAETLVLAPLDDVASAELLASRGVAAEHHARVQELAHGLPLALALAAELDDVAAFIEGGFEAAPDLVQALLGRILDEQVGQWQRDALAVCAIARRTTEELLRAVLTDEGADAAALFERLSRASFVCSDAEGIHPHEVARAALRADLRWRDPGTWERLWRAVRDVSVAGLATPSATSRDRGVRDVAWLLDDSEVWRGEVIDTGGLEAVRTRTATAADWEVVGALVGRHEGAQAVRWLEACRRRGARCTVLMDRAQAVEGYIVEELLDDLLAREGAGGDDDDDGEGDPALALAARFLADNPWHAGLHIPMWRFWGGREHHQERSPVGMRLFVEMSLRFLALARVAFVFSVNRDPERWRRLEVLSETQRFAGAFTCEGHEYGVMVHDLRACDPIMWFRHHTEALIGPPPERGQPVVVLDRAAFARAVHDLLRAWGRRQPLATSPLFDAPLCRRLAGNQSSRAEREAALLKAVGELVQELSADATTALQGAVLHRTYVVPAAKQRAAAFDLGLSFSTYRRYLVAGEEALVQRLWAIEVGAADAS